MHPRETDLAKSRLTHLSTSATSGLVVLSLSTLRMCCRRAACAVFSWRQDRSTRPLMASTTTYVWTGTELS